MDSSCCLYNGFGGLLPPRPANMYDFATASFCISTSAGPSLSWLYDFGLGVKLMMLLQVHFDFLYSGLVACCHQDLQTCMTSPRPLFVSRLQRAPHYLGCRFGLGGGAFWMLQVHFDFLCIVVLVAYCHQDLQTCKLRRPLFVSRPGLLVILAV